MIAPAASAYAHISRANDRRRPASWRPGRRDHPCSPAATPLRMGLPVLAVVATHRLRRRRAPRSRPRTRRSGRRPRVATRPGALAQPLGSVAADDLLLVISRHDTSTLANDPNETEGCAERLADALGRSPGRAAVRGVPEEPHRTRQGRRAAVFQTIGLCQVLRDGVIPPNRSLDCVDDELAVPTPGVAAADPPHGGSLPAPRPVCSPASASGTCRV